MLTRDMLAQQKVSTNYNIRGAGRLRKRRRSSVAGNPKMLFLNSRRHEAKGRYKQEAFAEAEVCFKGEWEGMDDAEKCRTKVLWEVEKK